MMRGVSRVAIITVMIMSVMTAGVAPMATAQNSSTDTADTSSGSTAAGSYSVDIDRETRIEQAEYDKTNKTLTVTISNLGDGPERVLIAQVIESGADRMAFRDMTVYGDSSRTVTLRQIPDENGDPAVMVATETSLEDGSIEWIPTGSKPLSETVSLGFGVGVGVITMTSMTAIMAYRQKTKHGDEPEDPFDDDGLLNI